MHNTGTANGKNAKPRTYTLFASPFAPQFGRQVEVLGSYTTSPQPTCGAKAQKMEWTQPTSSAKAERKVVSVVWYLVSRRRWKLIGQKCILTYGVAGLGLSYT